MLGMTQSNLIQGAILIATCGAMLIGGDHFILQSNYDTKTQLTEMITLMGTRVTRLEDHDAYYRTNIDHLTEAINNLSISVAKLGNEKGGSK